MRGAGCALHPAPPQLILDYGRSWRTYNFYKNLIPSPSSLSSHPRHISQSHRSGAGMRAHYRTNF